jgi:hypothetical protein
VEGDTRGMLVADKAQLERPFFAALCLSDLVVVVVVVVVEEEEDMIIRRV